MLKPQVLRGERKLKTENEGKMKMKELKNKELIIYPRIEKIGAKKPKIQKGVKSQIVRASTPFLSPLSLPIGA